MEYTLSYSPQAEGWPSFYSYYPDWMIGMNNYFYTFKGGNLYRHNTNTQHNVFYYDWWLVITGNPVTALQNAFTPSMVKSVFNDVPLENKLYKTINLEGDHAWQADLYTDIQTTGLISKAWFEKKEGAWFAFLRNTGTTPAAPDEYALRSVNGIGNSVNISGPANATVVSFSINPLIQIGGIISIGDYLYYSLPPTYATPILFGRVDAINVNYPAGINRLVVDTTIAGGSVPAIVDPYILYIKNQIAESHGLLGHYCVFTIENDDLNKVELFAVESEVMKSYP